MTEQERKGRAKARADYAAVRMQTTRGTWDRRAAFTSAGRRRATKAVQLLTGRLDGGYDTVRTHRKGYNEGTVGWWGSIVAA